MSRRARSSAAASIAGNRDVRVLELPQARSRHSLEADGRRQRRDHPPRLPIRLFARGPQGTVRVDVEARPVEPRSAVGPRAQHLLATLCGGDRELVLHPCRIPGGLRRRRTSEPQLPPVEVGQHRLPSRISRQARGHAPLNVPRRAPRRATGKQRRRRPHGPRWLRSHARRRRRARHRRRRSPGSRTARPNAAATAASAPISLRN